MAFRRKIRTINDLPRGKNPPKPEPVAPRFDRCVSCGNVCEIGKRTYVCCPMMKRVRVEDVPDITASIPPSRATMRVRFLREYRLHGDLYRARQIATVPQSDAEMLFQSGAVRLVGEIPDNFRAFPAVPTGQSRPRNRTSNLGLFRAICDGVIGEFAFSADELFVHDLREAAGLLADGTLVEVSETRDGSRREGCEECGGRAYLEYPDGTRIPCAQCGNTSLRGIGTW